MTTSIIKFFALVAPMILLYRKRAYKLFAVIALAALTITVFTGCGSNSGTSTGPTNLRYTPAGTYEYQITASSTTGPTYSSTVTLNLIVQ